MNYNLSAVGGEAFCDTDHSDFSHKAFSIFVSMSLG